MTVDQLPWDGNVCHLPDACRIEINGNHWCLTLPSGKHIRGRDPAPRQAAWNAYVATIIDRWMRGELYRGGFLCPKT
jgi:hypothetical protein